MLFAFSMDILTAQEFYRRAEELGAETEEERTAILMQMVEEGLIQNVVATDRTKEKYLNDLKKNFKVWEPKNESL